MLVVDREELAWAAGLFDGEGWVGPINKRREIGIRVGQVDRRVLDRFAAAVGVGTIYGPYRLKRSVQSIYVYHAGGFHRTQAVMAMLWRWLSPVKRQQYAASVAAVRGNLLRWNQSAGSCKRGHHLSGDNLARHASTGARVCRECRRLASAENYLIRQTVEALIGAA